MGNQKSRHSIAVGESSEKQPTAANVDESRKCSVIFPNSRSVWPARMEPAVVLRCMS